MHKSAVLNSQISQEHSQHSDQENNSDEQVEQRFIPRVDRNLNYQADFSRTVLNIAFTNYPVVKEVANSLGMRVIEQPEEANWDVCWTDHPITPQTSIRMHFHQSINYIPGIHTIARKNELGIRLNLMNRVEPNQYNFYPATWMLPDEFSQLRRYMDSVGKGETFIVKPQANCQGRGIYLANKLDDIMIGNHCVVQRYIDNPLLIDGYKFDLRVYVLIGSIDPLRIYLFHDGLARFATEIYESAQRNNFKSTYQHLTNYAINKFNPKFKEKQSGGESEGGFKRSMKAVLKTLAQQQVDTDKIWRKIEDIAIKTVFLGYQKMRHNYVSSQPEQYHNRMAFHIIGLDILIDNKFQPFLLEVNHTPSFATETPLDNRIKTALIKDTLVLMRLNDLKMKQELFHKAKVCSSKRMEQGRRQSYNQEIRQKQIELHTKMREQHQKTLKNGYKLIFPSNEQEKNFFFIKLFQKVKKCTNKKNLIQKKIQLKKIGESQKQKDKWFKQPKVKQHQNIEPPRQKKCQFLKLKSHSIYTQRVKDQPQSFQNALFQIVKKDLSGLPYNLAISNIGSHNNRNRTFTIKTKLSIPEVIRKPSIKSFQSGVKQQKIEKLLNKNQLKGGSFLKPKTYDVPALLFTTLMTEEQRIVRKKNKQGRPIFHLAKS